MPTPEILEQATSSTSITGSPPSYDEARQEAGPLPLKQGELGFIEGVHVQTPHSNPADRDLALPERHPADRDAQPTTPSNTAISPPPAVHTATRSSPPNSATPPAAPVASPKPRILRYLKPKLVPGLGGVRLITFLAFLFQLIVLTGCVTAWVFTGQKISEGIAGGHSSVIFVHVVFAFAIIGQLIFLERRVYRIRAERYAHVNPGAMLPRYRNRAEQHSDMALSFAYAPWNRPPLPTYAAVLAQSGHGTGDVDDHLIAIAPPPAYGNTRGSRMLLQGFLTEELRAQRPTSAYSTASGLQRTDSNISEGARDQQREQTLAQLENSSSRNN
ncbi:hypothetical protein FA15DRAFT_618616 [Coprinopsis marcescibilis]|uniref:Uncharacterized protein n=1 Tax=Coprinopsis marcescibilis TaxID=230819 RepID=A0A5C3KWZ0_COPMA|nr:hypothetical protein FA15DRAFT_618616 [Coprinopsis marcescibilis]